MRAGKTIMILLVSVLLFCPVCNACGETAEPDYYHIGLEVTGVMSEIVDNEGSRSKIERKEPLYKKGILLWK